MAKKIALISFVAALLGLINELSDWFKYSTWGGFLHIVNVAYMGQTFEEGKLNFVAVGFFSMFAFSAFLYWKSDYRETRLLRLCLAFIFFSKILSLSFSIGWTAWILSKYPEVPFDYLSILFWILVAFHGWLCFKGLQFLNSEKELATEESVYGETTVVQQLAASNWTRFFHSLFDGIIIFFVVSPFAEPIVKTFFGDLVDSGFGIELRLYVVIFVFQILYYLIFETIFASSPAKFLSESRVVNSDGEKPNFKAVLARTFSRFIPFDGLSFLFGGNWHDQISSTEVVLEKRTGKSGATYLWSLLVFVLLLPVLYLMKLSYEDYQTKKVIEQNEADNKSYLEKRLDKLSPGDVIWLKSTNYAPDCIIVAESGTPKNMEFLLVSDARGDGYLTYDGLNIKKFAEFYELMKSNYETVTLTAEHLKSAIPKTGRSEEETFGLPGKMGTYTIESIDKLYAPKLKVWKATYYSDGKFRGELAYDADLAKYTISNDGSPAKVVKIVSHNDLKWKENDEKNTFPNPDEVITIEAKGDDFDEIDVEFTLRDELGRNHNYSMKAESSNETPVLKQLD